MTSLGSLEAMGYTDGAFMSVICSSLAFPWEWDIIIPAPGFHSGSLELDVSRINVSF